MCRRESVCEYLKETICSPADTEPEVSMSKAKGNIHQGGGNQASCTWQHEMGVSSQERYLQARMTGCTDPSFLAKMYVCHSEDGMVRQNDHHMMAVQMQLSTSGAHLACSVGYMTNTLLLVSDSH